jgi:hypothetical protein
MVTSTFDRHQHTPARGVASSYPRDKPTSDGKAGGGVQVVT